MNRVNFCQKCGNKLNESQRFCSSCGWKLLEQTQHVELEAKGQEEENILQQEGMEVYKQKVTNNEKSWAKTLFFKRISAAASIIGVILLLTGIIYTFRFLSIGNTNKQKVFENQKQGDNKESESQKANNMQSHSQPGPEAQKVNVKINQVDNSSFPLLKLYVSILGENEESIDKLPFDYFTIREKTIQSNNYVAQKIQSTNQIEQNESLSISLVMDTSGSMSENAKLEDAKSAASNFIQIVEKTDELEILEFNDFVRTKSGFTSDKSTLIDAVSQLYTEGQTALYDSMYTALVQISQKEGAKCVIVFTDGMSNKDTKTKQDVIDLSKKTGIPIYIIGIGNDVQAEDLSDIAMQTGGYFVHTPSAADLEKIYKNIFRLQKKQYFITYRSSDEKQDHDWREIELGVSGEKYVGTASREYTPQVVKPKLMKFDIAKIDEIIRSNAYNGNYSVVIKDLSNGEKYRAGVYQQRMPASALINVPITLAVADLIKRGQLSFDTKIPFYYTVGGRGKFTKKNDGEMHTVNEMLKIMMNYSDNNCTNSFLRYIGIDEVNRIMRRYGFSQTEIQRMILVTDGSKENWTTCEEIGKMLELLYSDSLPIGSYFMNANFKILDHSNRNGILKYLPSDAFVLHHNGITSERYNETAFIGHGSTKYILTVMSCNGSQEDLAETTALISKYVYDEMVK